MSRYELNVRDYLRTLRKRRSVIITTFIICLIGSALYLANQPTVYQSSTTIKIEERKTVAGLLTEWLVYSPADVMESTTRLIKGFGVMKAAALKLGMITPESDFDAVSDAVSSLQGSVQTERIGSTNMIRITTTSSTAKGAMALADTIAEVFIAQNLRDKAAQVRSAREFIEDQLAHLEGRMKFGEDKMKRYGADMKNIRIAMPIDSQLSKLQYELAELSQRYTDKYPRIVQLREQIADLESQIKGYTGEEIEYARLMRDGDINRKLFSMLREKLEEARITEAQKISDVSVVDPAFLPRSPVSTNTRLGLFVGALMGLVLGAAFAFVIETLDTSINTIDDVESMLKLRVLGMVPPLGKETKPKKGVLEDLKERFMPRSAELNETAEPIYLVAHFEPTSTAAEAYRNIQTNLKLDATQKTVLITSSGPREGKSTVASNLAIVMAQAGLKTLLVSADIRRPVLDKVFGIKREPGLNEYITGAASLKDVIRTIADIMVGEMSFDDIRRTPGMDNISIMPSGRLSYNPAEVLKANGIKALIDKLREIYDVIIFDAPPILPVTDASLLAQNTDATVLVYEIGRTSREALMRAKIQIEAVGAKIAGVVLNHTQPETEAVVTYPYYKYRYGYPPREDVVQGSETAPHGARG